MNRKGFIATSLIYSFFLVFVAVVATVLATYTHNRLLLKNINSGIIDDLNLTIQNKYVVLTNLLKNSDFEESGGWTFSNASIPSNPLSTYLGAKSASINKGNSTISQPVNNLVANHYYYFRLYVFRNGPITGSNNVKLNHVSNTTATYNLNINYVTDAVSINWLLLSNIVQVRVAGNYNLVLTGTSINGTFNNLNIDSLMLVDVTDIISAGNTLPNTKNYLDTIDYFSGDKSIEKP